MIDALTGAQLAEDLVLLAAEMFGNKREDGAADNLFGGISE